MQSTSESSEGGQQGDRSPTRMTILPEELDYGEKPDGEDDQEDGQLLEGARVVNLFPVR